MSRHITEREHRREEGNGRGLCLTRYAGEEIVIGDNITVTIMDVHKNGRVRVRVSAPRDITVHRREVLDRAQQEPAS